MFYFVLFGLLSIRFDKLYRFIRVYDGTRYFASETSDVDVNNIVISKLVETKTHSKYLIGYLNRVIRPLVLILLKMSGYVKTFKVKDRDKDKNHKLMSFQTKIEYFI